MSMTYKQRDNFEKALDKVSSMKVDDFQTLCQNNKLDNNHIDNLIFDVAKIIMEKEDERHIYSLKMESEDE